MNSRTGSRSRVGKKGVFLVLEGGDGAGKSSQLSLLAEFLRKGGRKVLPMHFPRLDARPYGEIIAAYLRGEYGGLDRVHPRLAALLYALDRREARDDLRAALRSGVTVLADRYIFSNLAYQGARMADPEEKMRMMEWVETLEYAQHRVPRPDLSLYLDAPLEFSLAKLASARSGADREYLGRASDIHESSRALQEGVRREFLDLAHKRPGEMGVVECRSGDGGMADSATVHSRVIDALRRYGLL